MNLRLKVPPINKLGKSGSALRIISSQVEGLVISFYEELKVLYPVASTITWEMFGNKHVGIVVGHNKTLAEPYIHTEHSVTKKRIWVYTNSLVGN